MARRSTKQTKQEDLIPKEDFSQLTEDQAAALLEHTFETLCNRLEDNGVDPELITGILFNHFTQRLCDVNDREQYEMILEMALETPWEEQTIH